jgi:uncharacterized protein YwgA
MEFEKHALVLAVIEKLRAHRSWTGKTHVQKTIFLLNEVAVAKSPFTFVLYKHGPFSFDLERELEQMESYAAIASETVESGYGVILRPGRNAEFVRQSHSLADSEVDAIEKVARFVGRRNVADLERLASAVWIRSREGLDDSRSVAERMHQLKPHVSIADAEIADHEISLLFQSAGR